MNFVTYSFVQRNNNIKTERIVNLDTITDTLIVRGDTGKVMALQLLSIAPTTTEWDSVPDRARYDKNGQIWVNKQGYQEIVHTKKQVQKHVIISITGQEDITNCLRAQGWDDSKIALLEFMSEDEMLEVSGARDLIQGIEEAVDELQDQPNMGGNEDPDYVEV